MATGRQQLAEALKALQAIQEQQGGVVQTSSLKDTYRVLLIEKGFLRPIIKGWYFCSSPHDDAGDSTSWYIGYWSFLGRYLKHRFDEQYCLNAEASLKLHTGSTFIPTQLVVVTTQKGSSSLSLPFGSSLLIYEDSRNFPAERTSKNGLQCYLLAEALCRLPPRLFITQSREIEIALGMIGDVQELLRVLLNREQMDAAAGRMAGALRFFGRTAEADRVMQTMRLAGRRVREVNPFTGEPPTIMPGRERSPYVLRIASMWQGWRDDILELFPSPPGLPDAIDDYMHGVDERSVSDAYHSLSIEGYQVSEELIARILHHGWNPDDDDRDGSDRNALAARGYHQAFKAVRNDIRRILKGDNPGTLLRQTHHQWYAELFAPSVSAGLLEPYQLAGYRTGPVFIRNARHIPPPHDALPDAMEKLFDLIEEEPEPSVRAVLAHHLLVFIHPWVDGNGRIARFLMNALLASGGYPWTVIRVEHRGAYMEALEQASSGGDIRPLAGFIARAMTCPGTAVF